MEKAIYINIKERVEETRREDKRFSELRDKMEKIPLQLKKRKNLRILIYKDINYKQVLFVFGIVTGYEILEENNL